MKSFGDLSQRQQWRALYEREWPSLPLCFCAGILLAAICHLLAGDAAFHHLITSREAAVRVSFEGPRAYSGYAFGTALALTIAALPWLVSFNERVFRSLRHGVMCGLRVPALVCGFITYFIEPHPSLRAIVYCVGSLSILTLFALTREHARALRIERIPTEDEVRVPDNHIRARGTRPTHSSEPIEDWAEDTIDRVSVINALTFSLLIA